MYESFRGTRLRRGMRAGLAALALSPLLALAANARADCGDVVGGKRVACVCGDVVVGDTRLEPTDPVVSAPCAADGLIVRARAGTPAITLDLNGLTLRGAGVGVGVLVLDGGTEGATIVGARNGEEATIAGFREAVRATARGALASVAGVNVAEAERAGVVVRFARDRRSMLEVEPGDLAVVGSKRERGKRERQR